jgi:rubrerythrin
MEDIPMDSQTEDNGEQHERTYQPIYVYWYACSQCGYETAAHGRVACPDCGCGMTAAAFAGAIIDSRGR